ncbi:hypothetical protein INT43_003743, partial [Umbelopsis isabellina]
MTVDQNEQILDLMKSLNNSQSTRVELYQEFDDAFKDYKTERLPVEQYQSICGIVTEGFQEVSQQIQNVERQLKESYSRPDLADLIRKLQERERQKLKLTVNLQIWDINSVKSEVDYSESISEART